MLLSEQLGALGPAGLRWYSSVTTAVWVYPPNSPAKCTSKRHGRRLSGGVGPAQSHLAGRFASLALHGESLAARRKAKAVDLLVSPATAPTVDGSTLEARRPMNSTETAPRADLELCRSTNAWLISE